MRVPIQKSLIDWAIARARLDPEEFALKYAWLRRPSDDGTIEPTIKQLETFSAAAHVPLGYLFLPEPPSEEIPIPDFRTMSASKDLGPSPNLLDTIYLAQNRQDWYRTYMLSNELEPPKFIGSASLQSDVEQVAREISEALRFSVQERAAAKTWTDALSRLVEQTDDTGVLVMINGVVGNNTHRKLDPQEFRGFALFDEVAPLVFVNGADTKSAQMFTIVHELAHIWAGKSALTDSSPEDIPTDRLERWCDEVAAEVLVPMADFETKLRPFEDTQETLARLAREYKVSTLVILRRLFDAGNFKKDEFWKHYDQELERLRKIISASAGGNFYNTQNFRVSRKFSRALLESTFSGRTLYGDALRLMSVSNVKTLQETARRLEVV